MKNKQVILFVKILTASMGIFLLYHIYGKAPGGNILRGNRLKDNDSK